MMYKRYAAALLAALMTAGALISCGGAAEETAPVRNENDALPAQTAAEETAAETEAYIADGLPDTDLSDYKFRIYCLENLAPFFYSDELDGDVVNDAVYKSVLNVEERFGVDIVPVYYGTDDGGFSSQVNTLIKSGDDVFDVAENHDTLSAEASLSGNYMNVRDFPYLDFEKPWYPTNAIESLTLYGKLFLFSSAMSYKGLHQTRILYMNKKLFENYGIESPYQDVFDGKWTLDNIMGITKGAYQDLNSNQKPDEEDFFGFTVHQWFDGWMDSFDLESLTKDAEGELVIGINNQRTADIVDKMYTWIAETPDTFIVKGKVTEADIFSADRALITYGEISTSYVRYRNTDIDYGMLPFPKYDENQEDYISFYTDRFFVVPKTAHDTDKIGFMLEAMSAEGYRTIYPAYYEIALKVKYTQDDESARILDVINASRKLSFSYCYDTSGLNNIFGGMFSVSKPSHDFASFYAKKEKSALKRIEKIKAAYQDN